MTFESALAEFKAAEDHLGILALLDGGHRAELMRRVVVAWGRIEIRRTEPGKFPKKPGAPVWSWLWGQVDFDLEELSGIVGKPVDEGLLDVMIGNRLIYPDGTVSETAKKMIGSEIRVRAGIEGPEKQNGK